MNNLASIWATLKTETCDNNVQLLPSYDWTLGYVCNKAYSSQLDLARNKWLAVLDYLRAYQQISINIPVKRLNILAKTGQLTSSLQKDHITGDYNANEQVWLEDALGILNPSCPIVYASVGLPLQTGQAPWYGNNVITLKPHVLTSAGYLYLDSTIYFGGVDPYQCYRQDLIATPTSKQHAIECSILTQALIVWFRYHKGWDFDEAYDLTREWMLSGGLSAHEILEALQLYQKIPPLQYIDMYPIDGELHIFQPITVEDIEQIIIHPKDVDEQLLQQLQHRNLLVKVVNS